MKRAQHVEPWNESEEELGKRLKAAVARCTYLPTYLPTYLFTDALQMKVGYLTHCNSV